MSRRHIARLMALKEQQKQQESEESDDDQDAGPSVQQSQTFQGLEVSSDSETEEPALGDPVPTTSLNPEPSGTKQHLSANIPEEDKYGAKKKTYTKAQLEKKARKAQKESKRLKKHKVPEGIDEVDWVTQQINEKLGDPPQRVGEIVVDKRENRKNRLLYINPDHLDVNNELAKVYGDKDAKSPHPPNRRASHWIGVSPNIRAIRIKGIVMTCYQTEGRIKFFRFTHSQEYRTRCVSLIQQIVANLDAESRVTTLYTTDCVEAYIENCDILYTLEEHSEGRLCLEQCLFCMQRVAEPSFSYVDGNTRLLYEFVENRPFHVALLKYVHILSNTAFHITALALGKVLLSLDPSDPLAVSSIIDTLAIRAREFKWLIDYIEESRQRFGNRLFNMRYSRALALFHIARRTQQGEVEAEAALSKAIISYPSVALQIINLAKIPVPEDIKNHALFKPPANYPVPCRDLQQFINFYAWLTAPRWKEPFVSKWFIKVLIHTTAQYNESSALREKALENATLVARLYLHFPTQLVRHLYIIRSMSSYIGGGQMPTMRSSVSFNPFPTGGTSIDTYSYYYHDALQPAEPAHRLLMGLLESILPVFGHSGVILNQWSADHWWSLEAVEVVREAPEVFRGAILNCQEMYRSTHRSMLICKVTHRTPGEENSREIREILIDFMNISNIDVINLADEVPTANGEFAPALMEQLFYPVFDANMPGPSGIWYEQVEVAHSRTMNEDDEYFAEIFLTDEEKELPMIISGIIIYCYIVGLQVAHYDVAGEYLHSYAQPDCEPTFEEPPIE